MSSTARLETGGQLASAQSTAGSGSTCGKAKGPASKSGLQTTPLYQQITATGAAQIWVQSGKFMGSVAPAAEHEKGVNCTATSDRPASYSTG